MRSTRVLAIFIAAMLLAAALTACGCGEKAPSLSFPSSGETPVINYSSYKAISPVYNPDVPVVVIYPDGTMITKQEPYRFTTGKLSHDQITEILETLKNEGFFELKKEYGAGKASPGGSTETVTVVLDSGTYEVSVVGGAGPPGWNDVVGAITGAKASGEKDFVPSSVILFSKVASEVPGEAVLAPWPGQAADLAGAAAQDGKRLEGESAATAWKALQGVFAQGGAGSDAYWTADGGTYTYVYAKPELPGVEQ